MRPTRFAAIEAAPPAAVARTAAAPRSVDTPPSPVVSGGYRGRDLRIRRVLTLSDLSALIGALIVTAAITAAERQHTGPFLAVGALSLPLAPLVLRGYRLYDLDSKRISHSTVDDLPGLFHAMLVFCLIQCGWFLISPDASLSVAGQLIFFGSGLVLLVAFRVLARKYLSHVLGPERAVIVGDGPSARALERKMAAHPEYDVVPVGMVRTGDGPGYPIQRRVDVATLVERHNVDRIIVSHTDLDEEALLDLIAQVRQLGVKVSVLPQVFDALGPSVELDDVEGLTLLAINPPVLSPTSRTLKRTLDLVGASFLLVALTPVVLIVAAVIKLDSPGPVLFRQRRVGRGGRPFGLLKFRTMYKDAEARRAELMALSSDPNWLLLDHDPRITRAGAFLRHTSLDELPQLWNVVRGQMSLVGPRPLIEDEESRVNGWGRNRLDLTPGMTGLWQVLGRTRIPFEEMVKLDYLYVTNWSLWGDVRLLIKTFDVVVRRRGAN